MIITDEPGLTQGDEPNVLGKTIESEDELKAYLNSGKEPGEGEGEGTDDKTKNPPPPAKKQPEVKKPTLQQTAGEGNADEPGVKDGEDDGDGEDDKPVEYPTVLHYLNEKHKLALNLEEVTELTKEQEAEALDGLIERMTTGVNQALEEYQYIETLLQDSEIQEVLKAKHEGKSLRDLYSAFSQSPSGMSDDALAVQDFKKRFPKSPEEAIQGMVDSLKKNGQFDAFVTGLREQHAEEQSLEQKRIAEESKRKAEEDRVREREELERYSQLLSSTNAIYGVPLTKEMKEAVFNMTTVRDEQGMTELDHALQSDEGTILAALGVAYMQELIRNGASIQKNRARGRVMDKIFETPELQGGGGRDDRDADLYSGDVLNRF